MNIQSLTTLLLVSASTVACASSMTKGVRAYEAGAHPQALVELREAEQQTANESETLRVRYALYRGLTHLSLGDVESAEHWLARAKAWVDRDRRLLNADERGKLITAWLSLGHEPGTWGAAVLHRR